MLMNPLYPLSLSHQIFREFITTRENETQYEINQRGKNENIYIVKSIKSVVIALEGLFKFEGDVWSKVMVIYERFGAELVARAKV